MLSRPVEKSAASRSPLLLVVGKGIDDGSEFARHNLELQRLNFNKNPGAVTNRSTKTLQLGITGLFTERTIPGYSALVSNPTG